ncbi:MAG: FGGY-family carbohydrate kinase [Acidimicrobiales bacterium]
MSTQSEAVAVIDVGSSSLRVSLVTAESGRQRSASGVFPRHIGSDGVNEFDALAMAELSESLLLQLLHDPVTPPISGLAITNQRASAIAWDGVTSLPVGYGISWQDIRTTGRCLSLRSAGIAMSPSESATKFEHLARGVEPSMSLRFGTIDTWLLWYLSRGSLHVTDASNAAMTGLTNDEVTDWSDQRLEAVRIGRKQLPRIVDSIGQIGSLTLDGYHLQILAILGDQQASLLGQGADQPGATKCTLGTGGMVDTFLGAERPAFVRQGPHGGFPVVAYRHLGHNSWAAEGAMLSAGSSVEWLCNVLLRGAAPSHTAEISNDADLCDTTLFVPALGGLGTPEWDFGARGAFVGMGKSTGRAELTRAVLRGIGYRAADIVLALEEDTSTTANELRVDGKVALNPHVTQALADALGRPVRVAAEIESTTLGAGIAGLLGADCITDTNEVGHLITERSQIEPALTSERQAEERLRWRNAVTLAGHHLPALSLLRFD